MNDPKERSQQLSQAWPLATPLVVTSEIREKGKAFSSHKYYSVVVESWYLYYCTRVLASHAGVVVFLFSSTNVL